MTNYCELEIGLHKREVGEYSVELRFSQSNTEADVQPLQGISPSLHFDFDLLASLTLDPLQYGTQLGGCLFADQAVQGNFAVARAAARVQDTPLRVRLFIGPSAPELNELLWETLRDPQDGSSLLAREELVFSRYLGSYDWRPIRLRPRQELRALVVAANPSDLSQYGLEPIDVADQIERIRAALGEIPATCLASAGSATLASLTEQLRDGYDILFLVCHGALVKCESWLWLEDETGATARVKGADLITRLTGLQTPPRLVVLASCQSAGAGVAPDDAYRSLMLALGPRLAEAGIPAVLAMQGKVSVQTASAFLPVFFRELRRDGQIDRATAVARASVLSRPDWWMPVLFLRLKSGRIWYVPGFAGDAEDPKGFKKWPSILNNIYAEEPSCTPILGPGLAESFIGTSKEIARRWSERFNFPMAPYQREDLPEVAQFMAVSQSPNFVPQEMGEYLRAEIRQRYQGLGEEAYSSPVSKLIERIAALRWAKDSQDPYAILAGLPVPLFITTTQDTLLECALRRAGKEPTSEICRWNDLLEGLPSGSSSGERPTRERPLVYHLFGEMNNRDSLVITEDDYFDFLIGVTRNRDLIPGVVRSALANSGLLFLGFQMEDWNFRVLLRSIMNQEGGSRRRRYTHVAVQVDPEQGAILEPEGARRFLESYFGEAAISIYWGSADDFLRELHRRRSGAAP